MDDKNERNKLLLDLEIGIQLGSNSLSCRRSERLCRPNPWILYNPYPSADRYRLYINHLLGCGGGISDISLLAFLFFRGVNLLEQELRHFRN